MFDNTPLDTEELIDQCRALAYAIVELNHPEAKELLMFILWERLDRLHRVSLHANPVSDEACHACFTS